MKLKNKKIIVTGAGSGIGKELTKILVKKGAHVIAVDINEKSLEKLKKEVKNVSTYIVDISNKDSLIKFKKECLAKEKEIDGLINNAGIIQPFISLNDLKEDTINRVMNINFYGPLHLIKLFLPELLTRKEAHIVNISSMGGFFPFPNQTIYGVSKAALKMLSEGLYGELINTNVKVTVVFPGAINTNIVNNSKVKLENINSYTNYKLTSASKAAKDIIKGIEKNKLQVYVGSDSKMMKVMYKLNPKKAIDYVNKKTCKK
ncbi:MAG TPA: SDR family NAD(P)-dependent oxidoreductase [Bacilli bacterium]|nr:SDR family NAD(P)-dependent oxidoreductase [Bacilli bacterium]